MTTPLSHQELRLVHDQSPIAVLAIDAGGIVRYANAAALTHTGLTSDQLLGHSLFTFYSDSQSEGRNKTKLLQQEEFIDQEFSVNAQPGKAQWVLMSSKVHRDEQDNGETYLFIRDISALKDRERLLSYLNKAAEELAKARDTQSALNRIAQFIVPKFANWFSIDLLNEGRLELLILRHQDPAKIQWAHEYRKKYPTDLNSDTGMAMVLKSGEPSFIPYLTEEMISAAIVDPIQRKAIQEIGLQSVITVAMSGSDKIIGVVSFVSSEPERHFDETDLDFAKNFASLIGLALENARLNEEAAIEIIRRKEGEEQFRFLMDAIPHKVWTSGPDGQATYYNQGWYDYTGIHGFEELREKIWDTIHPDERVEAAKEWAKSMQAGKPAQTEQRLRRHDGIYRWHLSRFTPHKDKAGRSVLWVGTSTDIHEHKITGIELTAVNQELSAINEELGAVNKRQAATNEELEQTEHSLQQMVSKLAVSDSHFRFLVQGAPVAIGVLNGELFIIESANEMIRKLWGKTEAIIGQPLALAMPELQGQPFLKILDEVYSTGKAYYGYETRALLEHEGQLQESYFNFIYQPLQELGSTHSIMVVAIDVTVQVNAKKELEAAYEQVRLSKQAAQLGTFDLDLLLGTMEWDERCRTLFGISHKDAVTYEKDFVPGLHPDDRERVLKVIEKVMIKSISKGDYDIEYRTVGVDDGLVRWIRAKGQVYFDEQETPVRFIGSVLDITDQKLDEIRLKESAEKQFRLASIVNTSDDTIISQTLDGILTSWNTAAEKMFGYTQEEALGQHISLIIPPERLKEEEFIISQIRQGKKVNHFDTIRVAKHGHEIFISLSVSPITNTEGTITGASKIARDISIQKENEVKLQRYTRNVEILNTIGKLVSESLDIEAILQTVTDTTTQLTGAGFGAFFYNKLDEKGESLMLYTLSGAPREAFEKFGMPRNTAVFGSTFRGEEIVRVDDITKDPRYGHNRPHHGMPKGHLPVVSYLAVPVISKTGAVIGGLFYGHPEPGRFTQEHENLVAGIASQASVALDNAKLYEEIKRLNLKKDEFIGMASHELKTPITSLTGYLQIIFRRLPEGDINKPFLEKALHQISKLSDLISDLLDVSKIESGQLPLTYNSFDLVEMVREVIEQFQYPAKSHHISFTCDTDALMISADQHRIEQVVINLLSNAVKYSPEADLVKVSVFEKNQQAILTVQDFGMGISQDQQERIFSRFYRVADLAAHISGLGIGLYICKEIISRHGGNLKVESEPGQGSVFSFELPTGIPLTS